MDDAAKRDAIRKEIERIETEFERENGRQITKEEKKAADHAAFLRSGGSWDPDYAEEFKKYIYEARRLGSREPVDDLPD